MTLFHSLPSQTFFQVMYCMECAQSDSRMYDPYGHELFVCNQCIEAHMHTYLIVIIEACTYTHAPLCDFQNGNNWDCIYKYWSVVRAMDAAGHQIASHTYSHPDLQTLTQAQVSSQMTLLHPIFQDIIGKVGLRRDVPHVPSPPLCFCVGSPYRCPLLCGRPLEATMRM